MNTHPPHERCYYCVDLDELVDIAFGNPTVYLHRQVPLNACPRTEGMVRPSEGMPLLPSGLWG